MKIQFQVVEVKAKLTASSDKEITVKLVTDDPNALKLQGYIGSDILTVEIENDRRQTTSSEDKSN